MVFHLKAWLLTWMDTVEQEVSADPMEAAIHLENQVRAFKKAPWNETYSKSGQDVGTSSSSHSNNCLQPAQQSRAMKWKRQISKGALKTSKTLSAAFLLHMPMEGQVTHWASCGPSAMPVAPVRSLQSKLDLSRFLGLWSSCIAVQQQSSLIFK